MLKCLDRHQGASGKREERVAPGAHVTPGKERRIRSGRGNLKRLTKN